MAIRLATGTSLGQLRRETCWLTADNRRSLFARPTGFPLLAQETHVGCAAPRPDLTSRLAAFRDKHQRRFRSDNR